MTKGRLPLSDTTEPLTQSLESPTSQDGPGLPSKESGTKLKKELGLLEGVAIILGIIIGSGKAIIKYFITYILL